MYAIVAKSFQSNSALQMFQLSDSLTLVVINVSDHRQIMAGLGQVLNKINSGEFSVENENASNTRMLREFLRRALRTKNNKCKPTDAARKLVAEAASLKSRKQRSKVLYIR